jgi:valyl-tRNA synthetase
MPLELPKAYDPQAAQAKWFSFWEAHGWFDANPNPAKKPHVIMIPLPNVTGALHMGHALNGTLQDLLTRWRRMQGYEALWMPGTDHAGIATQAVVEKRMFEEEGKTRHDVGRDELVKRIWKWKEEYEARILGQLKQLGASCDWRRVRFTLDDVCSKAVRRTFFKMFKDGLIYRGQRLVNWDVHLQTAVADDEVYTEEVPGKFWTFNYPVVDDNGQPTGDTISFSTTRPETMLGDTAVCVHPTDERYTHLVGKLVKIPLNGRLIPIIADALLADKELGTGCVKVTPAHDPNDYACGVRNKLPLINILNADGTLNENAGEWKGQDRAVAREAVVARMEKLGHFEKVEDRQIPLKFSDRSKTPIEPYLSDQWFVKMSDHDDGRPGLAQLAMDAVTSGRVKFFPERYQSAYLDWLAEKRDWCISRQLWWGHRIPVWRTPDGKATNSSARGASKGDLSSLSEFGATQASDGSITFSPEFDDKICARISDNGSLLVSVDADCMELEQRLSKLGFEQDPDVLDTWFSSALWPHATLGWPDLEHDPPLSGGRQAPDSAPNQGADAPRSGNEVLRYFYPGSVLVTSRDIITLWVARMVLTGLYNMGDVPFRHVHVHPKILDGFGQTMSKTKGNGVDPLELIERYGCDGMRFTIASFAGETQDVRLPVGYECPHCQNVIPQTQQHLKFKPGKPKIKCPKCKQESQYACPHYTPDPGEPVARIVIERFEYGRNFCNKLWNAARFAMLNLEGYAPGDVTGDQLALEDRWILSRLATVTNEVTHLLDNYHFDAATRSLREFVWNEFCDWYLELIKPRLKDESAKPICQRVLVMVLDTILRLLHPFTPFITEELWQRLNEIAPIRPSGGRQAPDSAPRQGADALRSENPPPSPLLPHPAAEACIIAPWPCGLESFKQAALERRFSRLQETIVAVRNLRGVYNISAQATVDVHIKCDGEIGGDLEAVREQFESLARGKIVAIGPNVVRPKAAASFSLGEADGYVPLAGLIDLAAEKARQQKEAEKLRGFIASSEKKLSNPSFTDRAPPEVVQEVRDTLANLRRQLSSVEEILLELEGV